MRRLVILDFEGQDAQCEMSCHSCLVESKFLVQVLMIPRVMSASETEVVVWLRLGEKMMWKE